MGIERMKRLEEQIRRCGEVRDGQVLKVDCFLNHQIDVLFMEEMAKEFHRLFEETHPTKVLTIEASGIPIAVLTAQTFGIPLVFAKKTESLNLDQETYVAEVYSYTRQKPYHIKVSKKYLNPQDRVLIIDDFLARGSASSGLMNLVSQSGATLSGVGVVIEKSFQSGGAELRQAGVNLHSLAMVASMSPETGVVFAPNPDDESKN